MRAVIEVENLTKQYRSIMALDHVNLHIQEGEIYGLIGKNGAGKSSLLRILCGQSTRYSGSVKLFGHTVKQDSNERKRIGALIEYPAFYPELTGRQNLEYYRIQRGISQKGAVEKVLNDLNLVPLADRKFKQYSLGNKQRLGIALALLDNPRILILDEPTNGLDPIGIKEIRRLLLSINREHNITIVISSHILSELEQVISKVGFIDNGKLIQELTMDELRTKCTRSVRLKVSNYDKIHLLLRNHLNNCEIRLLDNSEIQLSGDHLEISDITKLILDAGEKIHSVHESHDSLEDYFFQLVGGAEHEQLSEKRTV
ncbi:ABC transporter ATP-binding protein [Paenibacillus sp. YPG26]|uniref:ABC transporter ATP-binding protein n=1 Tax=Paenibacillus sp. YPG26 TaxID=2878915 RepID=UPI00203FD30E|nr:ABC transporter ATP-binding protein [Paenibacillus sp. YPG26]USB33638.1 ABC transporter ATP-binding protein [Paenibacillus sp. YPG26]